jgi:hypothetical protein
VDDDKICLVEVQSNVKDMEIRQKKFEDDLLQAKLAVAKTRNFAPDAQLAELAVSHVRSFTDIAYKNFAPSVVAHLDAALASVPKGGQK